MVGLTRENAARYAMRNFGFDDLVINETIKELLELYGGGEDAWRSIEDGGYNVLLNRCLEKHEEQKMQVDEEQEEEQEHYDFILQDEDEAVMDTSPFALLRDQGYRPVEGAGWLSEEDTDPEEDGHVVVVDDDDDDDDDDDSGDDDSGGDDDDDDVDDDVDDLMIQLSQEPLCEELEEMLREFQERNRKSD